MGPVFGVCLGSIGADTQVLAFYDNPVYTQ